MRREERVGKLVKLRREEQLEDQFLEQSLRAKNWTFSRERESPEETGGDQTEEQ